MKIKANKSTYILLLLVVGIWGYFLVSLFSDLNPDYDPTSELIVNSPIKTKESKKESFELLETTRDPFQMPRANKANANSVKKSKVAKKSDDWPSIAYLGTIADGNNKQSMYVLTINGNQQLFKKGQTISDVTLLKASGSEITAIFNGTTKTIAIQ